MATIDVPTFLKAVARQDQKYMPVLTLIQKRDCTYAVLVGTCKNKHGKIVNAYVFPAANVGLQAFEIVGSEREGHAKEQPLAKYHINMVTWADERLDYVKYFATHDAVEKLGNAVEAHKKWVLGVWKMNSGETLPEAVQKDFTLVPLSGREGDSGSESDSDSESDFLRPLRPWNSKKFKDRPVAVRREKASEGWSDLWRKPHWSWSRSTYEAGQNAFYRPNNPRCVASVEHLIRERARQQGKNVKEALEVRGPHMWLHQYQDWQFKMEDMEAWYAAKAKQEEDDGAARNQVKDTSLRRGSASKRKVERSGEEDEVKPAKVPSVDRYQLPLKTQQDQG
ncbi:hypothetical protein LTR27_007755 [Elasticomyces elasticus]|nr:hypothetical protein LTR27_007755 [Elasticomyces elasticus]